MQRILTHEKFYHSNSYVYCDMVWYHFYIMKATLWIQEPAIVNDSCIFSIYLIYSSCHHACICKLDNSLFGCYNYNMHILCWFTNTPTANFEFSFFIQATAGALPQCSWIPKYMYMIVFCMHLPNPFVHERNSQTTVGRNTLGNFVEHKMNIVWWTSFCVFQGGFSPLWTKCRHNSCVTSDK